jgi:iron complex outermembrane recepter protein
MRSTFATTATRMNSPVLLYASFSHGYKAGGFNLDRSALGNPIFAPNDPRQAATGGFGTQNLQFDPEIVDAYEIGFKLTRPGFVLNVSAFHQQFENFQLNTFNGSVFLVQTVNGCQNNLGTGPTDASAATGACPVADIEPGVTSTGIEVEASLRPIPDLNFTAGITLADTRYQRNLIGNARGQPLDPALFLLPGDNLSNAPEWVGTASVTWTPDIGNSGLSGLFYLDTRLTGDFNTGSDLFPEKEQDSFVVVNGRIGLRGPEQRWAIEVWAQNLLDEDYQQVAFNTPFQGSNSRAHVRNFGAPSFAVANQLFSSFLAEPRTFGVTGRFRF